MKKELNLLQIIETEIFENEKSNIGPNGDKAFPEFKINDFTYLFEYKGFGKKSKSVNHFISFCIKNIWYDINNLTFQNQLWDYDFEGLNFLTLFFERITEIVEAYFLLLDAGHINQSQTVFRNYLELISILFACKMDKEFFFNYIDNFETEQEYTKHWYKKLKPEKVKKLLKSVVNKNDTRLISQNFLKHSIKVFTGEQRELLYSYSSSIAHARFDLLKSNNEKSESDILNISTDFLVNSTSLIKLIFFDEIRFKNSKIERSHQIVFGIWSKVLYNHILKTV